MAAAERDGGQPLRGGVRVEQVAVGVHDDHALGQRVEDRLEEPHLLRQRLELVLLVLDVQLVDPVCDLFKELLHFESSSYGKMTRM